MPMEVNSKQVGLRKQNNTYFGDWWDIAYNKASILRQICGDGISPFGRWIWIRGRVVAARTRVWAVCSPTFPANILGFVTVNITDIILGFFPGKSFENGFFLLRDCESFHKYTLIPSLPGLWGANARNSCTTLLPNTRDRKASLSSRAAGVELECNTLWGPGHSGQAPRACLGMARHKIDGARIWGPPSPACVIKKFGCILLCIVIEFVVAPELL